VTLMSRTPYPLSRVYGLLESGPVVLVATAAGDRTDVMPLSWHTMIEFEPPLVGFVLSDRNHSHSLLEASGECSINIPEAPLAAAVVGCGNCSGAKVDKFARFGLTPVPADKVSAPLIEECFAGLECRVVDRRLAADYCFYILEVVGARVDRSVKEPRTLHHRGRGRFMVAGEPIEIESRKK